MRRISSSRRATLVELSDLLWSLGWQMFQLQDPHPRSTCRQINILPASSQLFVDTVAIRNMLAAHITKWYIPPSVPPTTNTFRVSLKLWATVIWEGHVLLDIQDGHLRQLLGKQRVASLGPLIPVRTISERQALIARRKLCRLHFTHEDRESPLNQSSLDRGVIWGRK